ncbi:chaperone protein dnaJ 8, chloroplastic-like isoform X2 [Sesamum indicum]|uniref:Chaperone protein dnaJ 8, chloroplastic-like isoform X2 n=1 Tax=Sesamum indicum TaxID=4182 RepID=A0A6I9SS83_SESIN|nr:chaperone protein dnaJ 8, chloroplastic-like isoform X2 [Sesamum indicum]
MACAVGCGSASGSWTQFKDSASRRNVRSSGNNKKGFRVSCVSSAAVSDPYKTLRIQRGASESEVKKAFRQLALQYHPDVCRGSNCGVQFHQINEAYDKQRRAMRTICSTSCSVSSHLIEVGTKLVISHSNSLKPVEIPNRIWLDIKSIIRGVIHYTSCD